MTESRPPMPIDDELSPGAASAKATSPWTTRGTAGESAEFAGHLAALTRTGLPLTSGLRALASELPSRRVRGVMGAMADRLERGDSLDEAVVEAAGRFPPQLRGLLVAGAWSGRLADVLGQYVRYANLGANLRRRFWMAVGYPLFLITVLGVMYLFVCFWVVEAFEFILKDFGVEPPAITKLLFLMAKLTRERGAAIAGVAVASAAVALIGFLALMGPAERRKVVTGVPLFGPILRWSALAEFSHLAGLLVEAEMPLPEALELAGRGAGDAELTKAGGTLRRSVEEGRTLSDALASWPRCPAGLFEVLDGSEGRDDLAPSLHMAGDMFEARTRAQASFASAVVAGTTLLLLLWGIGFVMVALYLPVINLLRRFI